MTTEAVNELMRRQQVCVIIPTYNNAGTILDVVRRVLVYTRDVIVVNDGCTDDTARLLDDSHIEGLRIIDYGRNRGKGYALKTAFLHAREWGFRYAITIDADGQHFPEDIPLFVDALVDHPETVIVGMRTLNPDLMRRGSSFANKFSNFWFHVQTGNNLQDTQSGYRLYPLQRMSKYWLITSRYESELEFLVFSVWSGTPVVGIPVRVYYPPKEERVSSFRPVYDFTRISVLNTFLTFWSLLWFWPRFLLKKLMK